MRSAALSGGAGRRTLRLATAVVAVGVLKSLAVSSQAARATIFDKGFYEVPYTYSYDDCCFPVEVEGVASGQFRLRTGKGDQASAFFARDTFSYREVHTNLETGLSFHARHILVTPEATSDGGWEAARIKAEMLRTQLADGADFVELAKQHSRDATARDGGDLGLRCRGRLTPGPVPPRLPRLPPRVEGDAAGGQHPSADLRHPIQATVRQPARGLAEGNQAAGHHRGPAVKRVDISPPEWEDVR